MWQSTQETDGSGRLEPLAGPARLTDSSRPTAVTGEQLPNYAFNSVDPDHYQSSGSFN